MSNQPQYTWDWRNLAIKALILLVGVGVGVVVANTVHVLVGAAVITATLFVASRYPRPRKKVVWQKGAWPFDDK